MIRYLLPRLAPGCVASLFLCLAEAGSAQVLYHVTPLGDLPGGANRSDPGGLNDWGQATGTSSDGVQAGTAFFWDPEMGMIAIHPPPPPRHDANVGTGINNFGQVAGAGNFGNSSEAFIWSMETGVIPLGELPGGHLPYSSANAINNLGQVVGISNSWNGDEAFLWDAEAGMIGIGDLPGGQFFSLANAINDVGQVTGESIGSAHFFGEAFLWDAAGGMRALGTLPDGSYAFRGNDINNLGQIVGPFLTPNGGRAYLWSESEGFTILAPLDGPLPFSYGAFGINDHGQVVGGVHWTEGDENSIFIWDAVHGLRDLNARIDPCTEYPFTALQTAEAINNVGQVLGWGRYRHWAMILTPYQGADPDLDGDTDLTDLATVLANFGAAQVPTFAQGDIDEDTDVDLDDLAHVLVNFGNGCP